MITASLGKGIKLNKKRKRNQKRFYNVVSKRSRTTESKSHEESPVATDNHGFDDIASSTPLPSPSNSNEPAEPQQAAEPQQTELLEKYLKHQETMQVQAKTVSALREKHVAPSKKKQMLGLMREKGLYKKFPIKRFKKFATWLQSPSGGQLKCTDQIISEISRFVCNSFNDVASRHRHFISLYFSLPVGSCTFAIPQR